MIVPCARPGLLACSFSNGRWQLDSKQLADAEQVAASWLALMDAGRYAESWHASGELFQQATACAAWEEKASLLSARIGAVRSRNIVKSYLLDSVDGFPDGQYVVNEYNSSFADGGDVGERVTTAVSPDGVTRVVGYYII